MNPIPKRLLPQKGSYQKFLGNSGEGISFDTSVTIYNIKIEERKQYRYTANGKEEIATAILFYDCINSKGFELEPVVNSKITINSKEYVIVDYEILYANETTPHHYEIMLK